MIHDILQLGSIADAVSEMNASAQSVAAGAERLRNVAVALTPDTGLDLGGLFDGRDDLDDDLLAAVGQTDDPHAATRERLARAREALTIRAEQIDAGLTAVRDAARRLNEARTALARATRTRDEITAEMDEELFAALDDFIVAVGGEVIPAPEPAPEAVPEVLVVDDEVVVQGDADAIDDEAADDEEQDEDGPAARRAARADRTPPGRLGQVMIELLAEAAAQANPDAAAEQVLADAAAAVAATRGAEAGTVEGRRRAARAARQAEAMAVFAGGAGQQAVMDFAGNDREVPANLRGVVAPRPVGQNGPVHWLPPVTELFDSLGDLDVEPPVHRKFLLAIVDHVDRTDAVSDVEMSWRVGSVHDVVAKVLPVQEVGEITAGLDLPAGARAVAFELPPMSTISLHGLAAQLRDNAMLRPNIINAGIAGMELRVTVDVIDADESLVEVAVPRPMPVVRTPKLGSLSLRSNNDWRRSQYAVEGAGSGRAEADALAEEAAEVLEAEDALVSV